MASQAFEHALFPENCQVCPLLSFPSRTGSLGITRILVPETPIRVWTICRSGYGRYLGSSIRTFHLVEQPSK